MNDFKTLKCTKTRFRFANINSHCFVGFIRSSFAVQLFFLGSEISCACIRFHLPIGAICFILPNFVLFVSLLSKFYFFILCNKVILLFVYYFFW